MTILSLENASFAVGHVPLLDHTAFQLAQGEKIGLIGRNGAGKSSLLKILAGAQKLDDGQLIIQSSLKIVGESAAGNAFAGSLKMGELNQRGAGCFLPVGKHGVADLVAVVPNAELGAHTVTLLGRGEDLRRGRGKGGE